ncbi:guanine nucleotide exchange factor [Collybia nuda]|uniref:Guanine nucleotide exchange factor n=1 Tax=Collybia nuda TaxID=64659 RepID=A0A9P5XSL6_9AGAR|nr:guanine nucleotide exchange factor [Collybia nuda]
MADILKAYSLLSSSSARSDISTSLQSIIDASPFVIDSPTRIELMRGLLKDLKTLGSGSSKGPLTSKDAAQALLALKTLGKNPIGSEFIASQTNLSTLLFLSTSFKDDPDASSEALRCIANALLLVERARETFLEKEVGGGNTCVTLLEKSTLPDHVFILSRILFLSTASGPLFIKTLVEEKYHGRYIVDIIGAKLDSLTIAILSGTKMAREAMTDILKLTFNLLLHYPKMVETEPQTAEAMTEGEHKVIGDFWSSKLDGILPPLLRTFSALPPTFPSPISAPLTHVIHSLITIPITPSLHAIWLGPSSSSGTPHSQVHSSKPASPTPHRSSSSSRSDSPTRSQTQTQASSPTSPKPSTLDRALSVLAAGRRSLSRSPSPYPFPSTPPLQRAIDLLEVTFNHYFPGTVEVDDESVRDRCKHESTDGASTLDDILSPLVVLISRFCIADEASRSRVRQWLVPEDLDRSSPLEGRADTLGRCLRLLASVYHPRIKDAVGEMLFAMSDSNATTLSALVGYGNVAGFLFHKGILNAPPPPSADPSVPNTTPAGEAINPITGTTVVPQAPAPEMTDEEKEREMERLFVLFDRMEKTGALPASQNPMRKAVKQAAFGGAD